VYSHKLADATRKREFDEYKRFTSACSGLTSYNSSRNEAIFSLKRWLVAQSMRIASAASTDTAPFRIGSTTMSCVRTINRGLPPNPASPIAR